MARNRNHNDDAFDARLFAYNDFMIYEEDARTLKGHRWLTDNIMNFAVIYLADQIFGTEVEENVFIVYAAQCELIKYEDDPQELGKLLGDIGIAPNKWILFIYNDSDRPNEWNSLVSCAI